PSINFFCQFTIWVTALFIKGKHQLDNHGNTIPLSPSHPIDDSPDGGQIHQRQQMRIKFKCELEPIFDQVVIRQPALLPLPAVGSPGRSSLLMIYDTFGGKAQLESRTRPDAPVDLFVIKKVI